MKPEDVKPITTIEKLIQVEGLQPTRNPDSSWSLKGAGSIVPCIPAHEVGAIIKSAMLVQFESDTADNEHLFHEFEKERQAWLAKANELEKMK